MPRFFIDYVPDCDSIILTGDDAHHISRVLRMKSGENLTICDGMGTDYLCALSHTDSGKAHCHIQGRVSSRGEPTTNVTLFMALPKGDKMDFIVQKAVELGVHTIVPYAASRCVSRPDGKALAKKIERWRRIAREAAQQCGRGRIPAVTECVDFCGAAERCAKNEMPLFFYEMEQETSVRMALRAHAFASAGIMIGPEGGFEEEEAQIARQCGLTSVSLGPRILRCETAPLAALTAVLYESGNL
ncbi:MAG: 16S rRNA (uracil(1498)-N(3))-methyltransferase [Butyricicoccus pullicaecorum]|nr:16S rRNA (uracil(1498)-N(3))-methyltransferase [Butyricicoccus pullicaecorum]